MDISRTSSEIRQRDRTIGSHLGFNVLSAHDQIRLRWFGMGVSRVGSEWGTGHRPRCDGWHHLHLVISGSARVWTSATTVELVAGHAYWLPGNLPVRAACPQSYHHIHASFRLEVPPGIEVLESWPAPVDLGPWSTTELTPHWQGVGVADGLCLQALLLNRLSRQPAVMATISSPSDDQRALTSRLAGLEPMIDAASTVAWLAGELNLPVRTLNAHFQRILGKSPKDFLSGMIRERARELLLTTDLSGAAIAKHLGFADEPYFYRWFHRWHGVTPIAFRTAYRH